MIDVYRIYYDFPLLVVASYLATYLCNQTEWTKSTDRKKTNIFKKTFYINAMTISAIFDVGFIDLNNVHILD